MVTLLTMAGVVVRRDGKLLTVVGIEDRDGDTHLHIQGAAVDFWATSCELYHCGYRLVAAKPTIWDLWGRAVYGGTRSLQRRLGEARISINL